MEDAEAAEAKVVAAVAVEMAAESMAVAEVGVNMVRAAMVAVSLVVAGPRVVSMGVAAKEAEEMGKAVTVVAAAADAQEGVMREEVKVEASEVARVDCCTTAECRSPPPSGSSDQTSCSSQLSISSPPELSAHM
eukprot:4936302-Prymnesium_polylepis.1